MELVITIVAMLQFATLIFLFFAFRELPRIIREEISSKDT